MLICQTRQIGAAATGVNAYYSFYHREYSQLQQPRNEKLTFVLLNAQTTRKQLDWARAESGAHDSAILEFLASANYVQYLRK